MAPPKSNQRGKAAMAAMKSFGFPSRLTKTVLKSLLHSTDNNWSYVESDNYTVLVDAILQAQQDSSSSKPPTTAAEKSEREPRQTRSKVKREEQQLSPSPTVDTKWNPLKTKRLEVQARPSLMKRKAEALSSAARESEEEESALQSCDVGDLKRKKKPKLEVPAYTKAVAWTVPPRIERSELNVVDEMLRLPHREEKAEMKTVALSSVQEDTQFVDLLTHKRGRRLAVREGTDYSACLEKPNLKPGLQVLPNNLLAIADPEGEPSRNSYSQLEVVPLAISTQIDEDPLVAGHLQLEDPRRVSTEFQVPLAGSPKFEEPLAMIFPPPVAAETVEEPSGINAPTQQANVRKLSEEQHSQKKKENGYESNPVAGKTTHELADVQRESAACIDVASSVLGEVKLSFICSTDRPEFRIPNMEDIIKGMEDRCLKSYKFLPPGFSIVNLMKDMCQWAVELGSRREKVQNEIQLLDSQEKPEPEGVPEFSNGLPNLPILQDSSMPSQEIDVTAQLLPLALNGASLEKPGQQGVPGFSYGLPDLLIPQGSSMPSQKNNVTAQPLQLALNGIRLCHDANDVCRGKERVKIPVVNDLTGGRLPPSFYYIRSNIVHENAYVNFSLARIGNEGCCTDCFGDCLAAPIPCACAQKAGGEFAYNSNGLIKKQFLDECISMKQIPGLRKIFYCKSCPLERSKNQTSPSACKGHMIRKFVKECWSKCGCGKQCGNRVVQRGITRNLEVFFMGEGWGVRPLEDLPTGAFVCEYIGEIMTIKEFYNRTLQTSGSARPHPFMLDADWGSKGIMKDEEALCLDATIYGNVARFINEKSRDANLIEIPVEVETPDHHYYHLAFFTTREVKAFEELTWKSWAHK